MDQPGAVSPEDKQKYTDSVRVSIANEMDRLQYGATVRARFSAAIDATLERVSFPSRRQLYDMLAVDENRGIVWLLLPGFGATYTRTWVLARLSDGSIVKRVSLPHGAPVWRAVVRNGSIYVIERNSHMESRVARYDTDQ
jgi:hypothetical protein